MYYLLIFTLGANLTVLPGFRPLEQCEALGKAWVELASKTYSVAANYQCVPNK